MASARRRHPGVHSEALTNSIEQHRAEAAALSSPTVVEGQHQYVSSPDNDLSHVQASLHEEERPAGRRPAPGAGTLALTNGTAASGLRNETGEYNCFLNVVLQCLWHCRPFQTAFMRQGWQQVPVCCMS